MGPFPLLHSFPGATKPAPTQPAAIEFWTLTFEHGDPELGLA